jgi:hypothetical protein
VAINATAKILALGLKPSVKPLQFNSLCLRIMPVRLDRLGYNVPPKQLQNPVNAPP